MSEIRKRVEYWHTTVVDKPGEARRLLEFMSAQDVNLIAFNAFPVGERRAQLAFIPENSEHLMQVARDAGVELIGPKTAFLIQGEDRVGALVEHHLVLANAGVNVYAANGVTGGEGRFGYVIWIKPNEMDIAAEALGIE
ncbi:MAG: hypothetical protein GF307_08040 [candidate division Zixibacteria bacterium]|nr:hypothetical protein [candidate division Zixibacteria bacterium]